MPRSSPTLGLERQIGAFIRAGGYPHVAAEASGVPRARFDEWTTRGNGSAGSRAVRRFATSLRQAAAQARLRAETTVFDAKPLDWLKSGPGKESADEPGWSAPPRARQAREGDRIDPLRHPDAQHLLAALLGALTPFPEARRAAASVIAPL